MNNDYPYSFYTPEFEVLKKLSDTEKNIIVQNHPLYDEALTTNKDVNRILEEKKLIEEIRLIDHPSALGLYNFIILNEENKAWYLRNIGKINLVNNWIVINNIEFSLEDEVLNWESTFDFSQAKELWIKFIDDWRRIVEFLPRDSDKWKFLRDVLLLKDGLYWSSEERNKTEGYVLNIWQEKLPYYMGQKDEFLGNYSKQSNARIRSIK